jgi:hypothetical protein
LLPAATLPGGVPVIARDVLFEFAESACDVLSAGFFEHPPKSEAMMTKNAQIPAVAGCLIESMYELQYANTNRAICLRLVTDMSAIGHGLTYNRK